jgi:hypothetical protein
MIFRNYYDYYGTENIYRKRENHDMPHTMLKSMMWPEKTSKLELGANNLLLLSLVLLKGCY